MQQRKIDAMHASFGRCSGFCRDCDHLIRKLWDKTYYKCEVYGDSNSEATDWRVSWTACGMFNQPLPEGFVPIIRILVKEPRKEPDRPIVGQVGMFEKEMHNGSEK